MFCYKVQNEKNYEIRMYIVGYLMCLIIQMYLIKLNNTVIILFYKIIFCNYNFAIFINNACLIFNKIKS